MAWKFGRREARYYRSVRAGSRTRTVYAGSGKVAQIAYASDLLARAERKEAIRAGLARRDRLFELQALSAEFSRLAELMARAILIIRGYRQHDRGEWRPKLNGKK